MSDAAEESAGDASVRDAAGWRGVLTGLPPRELLRLIQAERPLARAAFTGFRASAEIVRHPVVLGRVVEYLQRTPPFAAQIEAVHLLRDAAPLAPATERGPTPKVPEEEKATDETRVKEKVKELRAAVRDKETRLAELTARSAALEKERDAARAEVEVERKARQSAEALAERTRRHAEREARRPGARPVEPRTEPEPARPESESPRPEALAPARLIAPALDEAMRRLINRGKYAVVAEVCRELQAGGSELEAADRGAVHALCAAALYGQEQDLAGEEQDRLAVGAYLDAGLVAPAAEAMARAFSHGGAATPRATETLQLQRLLALAGRTGELEAVQTHLLRLRVTAPAGYQRLRRALQGAGKKNAALLEALAPAEPTLRIGPDEVMALPTAGRTASSVTPRRLVEAVEAGDENFVTCARDGIETLRQGDAARADALLEAVALLHTASVRPLTTPLVRPVVVDASNVARYNPDPLAQLVHGGARVTAANLLAMRDHLLRRDYFPVLMIADANLRFLVEDRAAFLELVERGIVREALPGVPADATLIAEARERVAPLVTNDRLAEWGDVARRIERIAFDIHSNGVIALTPV